MSYDRPAKLLVSSLGNGKPEFQHRDCFLVAEPWLDLVILQQRCFATGKGDFQYGGTRITSPPTTPHTKRLIAKNDQWKRPGSSDA